MRWIDSLLRHLSAATYAQQDALRAIARWVCRQRGHNVTVLKALSPTTYCDRCGRLELTDIADGVTRVAEVP